VHERYRLFWPKFATQVQNRWPGLYATVQATGDVGDAVPKIVFNRVDTDVYEINFVDDVVDEAVGEAAIMAARRVWWVNQSDSWDVEYGAGVVRSSRYKREGDGHTLVDADTKYRKTVAQARRGDIVVHARKRHVVAFSQALEYGRVFDELPDDYVAGWQFRTEYFVLLQPVPKVAFRRRFINDNHAQGYPLNRRGTGNMGYFFSFDHLGLGAILDYVDLGESLPIWLAPHVRRTINPPSVEFDLTETERTALVNTRIGQALFRSDVIRQWGSCAVTGVESEQLLRASHIKPWSRSSNRERLDPANGLLLNPTLDHLFDRGLITFYADGSIVISESLSQGDLDGLGLSATLRLRLVPNGVMDYMAYHNSHIFD
jgi:hypothetical protein